MTDSTNMTRRKSIAVRVGNVTLGGDHPVVVQSMTNTDTADVAATVAQVRALGAAGSELVRITVNNEEAARAVPNIRAQLDDAGVATPLIGDFHYNGHILLPKYPRMAGSLAKYRINPGNVGSGRRQDENFGTIIKVAVDHGVPVRIGVNWGSLDKQLLTQMMDENSKSAAPRDAHDVMIEAMLTSALRSAEVAQGYGMGPERIVISAKVSGVRDLWDVYERLAGRCEYALHLGLTEAGMGPKGIVNSTSALAPLLARGIGDTIRVSLTPEPGAARELEVEVAQLILQSMGLRAFVPSVTACPGCGRTTSTLFQELAQQVQNDLKRKMSAWRARYPRVEGLRVAVMGCVVNGPGESKHADIGISLPGTGEAPRAPVYVDGKLHVTLQGETLAQDFGHLLEQYVEARYGQGRPAGERLS